MPERSCNQASSADTISSMSDYSEELSIQASISAEVDSLVASGAFEASAGYNKFSQDVASTESYRFQMTSYCLRFKAGLNKQGQKALPDFLTRAAQLDKLKSNGCAGTMVSAQSVNDVEEGLNPSTSTAHCAPTAPTGTAAPTEDAIAVCAAMATEAACFGTCAWTGAPTMVCEDNAQYAKWELLFHDFGTHYIDNLHLGGKMIFQIDSTVTASPPPLPPTTPNPNPRRMLHPAPITLGAPRTQCYVPHAPPVSAWSQTWSHTPSRFSPSRSPQNSGQWRTFQTGHRER
jgi:hypothetical protein